MSAPQVRVLSESDADDFWALRLRALREEPDSFGSAYEEAVDTPLPDVAKRLRSSDDSFVLGAFAPQLAAIIGCHRREGGKLRHKATIWGMYVAPEHRGLGLGRALLLSAIARASDLPGLELLLLQVATTNQAARALYESAGFNSYAMERRALKVGSRYLDEDLMALELLDAGAGNAAVLPSID
jgi:ribosomal protein S18 acetylase RimI-like enzyme